MRKLLISLLSAFLILAWGCGKSGSDSPGRGDNPGAKRQAQKVPRNSDTATKPGQKPGFKHQGEDIDVDKLDIPDQLKEAIKSGRIPKEQIPARKQAMKKILQTKDKRTVKRRFEKLKKKARQLGIQQWVKDTEKKLPKLLKAVGSRRIATTNNAIERFFRAFNRFYKLRCGFFSSISAKRELIFFMLMYLFIKQPETGKAPLEAIIPQAKNMPFYQLVNDPIMILMNTESVKQNSKMADFALQEKLLE